MGLQVIRKRRRAEGAVAFANEKFRGIPAAVAADVGADELRQRLDVLIDAPEILVLRLAHGVAEARSHGVKEDQIRFVQEAVRILGKLVGSGGCRIGIHGDHSARRK